MRRRTYDALVVGSGAGGATVAYSLARAGARVLVVEKGPHHRLADFSRDELRICRRNFFTPYIVDEPNYIRYGKDDDFAPTRRGWTACCVGGGTVHMSGFFYRMHPLDFRLRSTLGAIKGAELWDWPFDYATLSPYYDRAEYLLGVSGLASPHPLRPPRRVPYPLPPLLEHPAARRLDDALTGLGWHPFVTPRAVLSEAYDGRPRCTYSGLCGSYGCETGAKSSALATVLPKAVATGRCHIWDRRIVSEVLTNRDGKVTGAVVVDERGTSHRVRARVVCVAGGAIQSARLLLNSRSSRFPDGLANGNGRVGRHLHFCSLARVEAELLRDGGGAGIEGFDSELPWLGRSVQDFYTYNSTKGRTKGGTIRFDLVHPNPIMNAERAATRDGAVLWGKVLKEALRRRFALGKTLDAEIFAEFLPNENTRVGIHEREKDRFGVPVAALTVVQHARDSEVTRFLLDRATEAFEAMGADRIDTLPTGGIMYVLQGGTCAFGNDPAVHVLDPTCRSHEVDNLYVVDGSFLPTSSGVPNTLTIHANALRVADIVGTRLKQREL